MKKIKNRILPQDDSQEAQVLNHLRAGNRISNASAVSGYNIYRLSAVIERLRTKNWSIATIERKGESGNKYGEYKLIR
jgi:hypothetical protein